MPLRCYIDTPADFVSAARYALEMLLLPLGIDAVWVHDVREADFVYRTSADAAAFFRSGKRYDEALIRWETVGGYRVPILFHDPDGPDLVASAFYWLSGHQEVTHPVRDAHGRFPVAASLQQVLGILEVPVVDLYRELLAARLAQRGFDIELRRWGSKAWAFCATHDVDYLRKRRPGILYRDFVQAPLGRYPARQGRLRRLSAVTAQIFGPDPFAAAMRRMLIEEKHRGIRATWFIKTGAHGPRDLQMPLPYKLLQRLGEAGHEAGLHPSYHAHTHAEYLVAEKTRLDQAVGAAIAAVRQHYLRYDPFITPALHRQAGFRIDSTLGWAEQAGFRRGTCLPFRIYDASEGRDTGVWELPLLMMESALFNRAGMNLEAAVEATTRMMNTCRRFGGVFVGLWHNTLWDEIDCPGWGAHFLAALDEAVAHDAYCTSLSTALHSWINQNP